MRLLQRVIVAGLVLGALPSLAAAQASTRRITGLVTEQGSQQPLAAATVQVVGTSYGVQTSEDGHFSVLAPQFGTATLRVRRIGFKARLVPVEQTQGDVTIALEQDVLQLETQVVTGQATAVSSRNAANAVAVVSGEQVAHVPAATLDNALQGKVAGAVISQNSGAPGGGTQVLIRGTNTINGQYQPLYVIDGVIANNDAYPNGLNAITLAGPATPAALAGAGSTSQAGAAIVSVQDQQVNRIADLNPNDIESIEIL